ncbi:ornithine cyclodeaminase family protein [Paraburkholderia bryophila]|uniref:Ornithine cyclodeaminase n=1 Tax=Paraburkholderia bryophila TaxID=420952 RepID=A0A329BBX3_9BURK|nr:ornithine cyclodeaminase family protein [Paraburkholderia bryophila]RAS19482.1 ornithine cyclodeaminase [Paraburkholderia bryophila]
MKLITDEQVRQVLTMRESREVVRGAFLDTAYERAATLPRSRVHLDHLTLSVMGGIVPDAHVSGAKIYSTHAGRFDFVVVLFDTNDGRFLATIQGNALTEFRTAATTAVAVEAQLPPGAHTLTVFGAGVQARAHLAALLELGMFRRVFIVSPGDGEALAASLAETHPDLEIATSDAPAAVSQADVLITCTRSETPLFDGRLLKPDVFVAAIGSSKPRTREIDDVTLQRASRIVVEHKEQARKEAGDLLMAKHGTIDWDSVVELGQVLAASDGAVQRRTGITVYKSVGIGLVDVALSALVYRKADR